jgi:hypothetical protein
MRFCNIRGCRYPESHLSVAHRCGTCGMFGHGQMQCKRQDTSSNSSSSSSSSVHPQASVPSVPSTHFPKEGCEAQQMPRGMWCTIEGCKASWSHTSDGHHCEACGGRRDVHQDHCEKRVIRVACPTCRARATCSMACQVFTSAECVICCVPGPCVVMSPCMHANVCIRCARIMEG